MSQYPWIYQPPSAMPGYDPAAHLLAPARRAGTLAIILGSILLLCGIGMLLFAFAFEQLPLEVRSQLEGEVSRSGVAITPQALMTTAAVFILVVAAAFVALGILSLRGGMGWIVSLMVVTALLLIFWVVQLAGGLVQTQRDPRLLVGVCFMVIPLVLLALLMWFLIAAVRAAPQIWLLRQQQQAQFWQYQQNQQQYQQGQWPAPPPPPPPHE